MRSNTKPAGATLRRLAIARYGATGWRNKLIKEFQINRKTLYRWETVGPRPIVLLALQAPRTGRSR